jgi:diketogulonate reductase-like aldo/keto reductase
MAPTAADIPFLTLNNGKKMPVFGLGTWQVYKQYHFIFISANYIMPS